MLYVKIMSDEDLSDAAQSKNFVIVPVQNNEVMQFVDTPKHLEYKKALGGAQGMNTGADPFHRFALEVHGPEGGIETHLLTGNAYVMTESGKTIASHAA